MNQRDQIFRDNTNDNYCLFNPMLSWINNIKEQTNNFTTDLSAQKIKTYSSFYNNLLKLMKKYVNGIPESDLQLVSNKLNIKIEIKFPFECKYADNIISTTPWSSKTNNKKNIIKTFTFINNKINHLENISEHSFTNLSSNNTINITSSQNMNQIYTDLLSDPIHKYEFSYKRFKHTINKIFTKDCTYVLSDMNYKSCVEEFENMYNIDSYKFNILSTSNKTLSDYVFNSIHYNVCKDTRSLLDICILRDDKNIKNLVT